MKRLILAGGGHGHIYLLKRLGAKPLGDLEILLISDYERQYYSGMIAGFLGGIYTEEEVSFNIPELCKRNSIGFIKESITAVDGTKRVVETTSGQYPYDYLSMNLGSRP